MTTIHNLEVKSDRNIQAQDTPVVRKLINIVKDTEDIYYINSGESECHDIVALKDFDASKYASQLLTRANLIGLQKEYAISIITELRKIEEPVILADSDSLDIESHAILLLPLNSSTSENTENIIDSIESSITDYPFINDVAEDEFFMYEHSQKENYIYGDFISDFEDILHWPLTWYKTKFPDADHAQFIDWMKNSLPYSDAEGILDSIEEHINIQQDGSLDFSTEDIKKYAVELAEFIRGVILEWKKERINKWKKDWLVLPGVAGIAQESA